MCYTQYVLMSYVGVICQFFILPFLGFLAVKSLDMPKVMGLTLLVVTSSPGGSFSNWWCSLFNADLALSVTMTTVSTFLSLVMLPLNLFIYSSRAFDADVINTIDWEALVVALVIVIAAILLGLLCSSKIKSKAFSAFCNKVRGSMSVHILRNIWFLTPFIFFYISKTAWKLCWTCIDHFFCIYDHK